MIIDYYEKYKLSMGRENQLAYLKNTLRNEKKFYAAFLEESDKLKLTITSLEEVGEYEKAKKYRDTIRINEREILEKARIIGKIESVISENINERELSDDEISNLYFTIHAEKLMYAVKRKYMNLEETDPNNKPEFEKLRTEAIEIYEMYKILSKPESRKEYNSKLEQQRYLQSLERGKKERLEAEEKYVKGIMGETFDPNMSHYKRLGKPYIWNVQLYDEPEKLFLGESIYSKTPQANQEIYAYRYGAFAYGTNLSKNGEPTYSDNLCEVIGITKIAKDGTETTNFVIAPLRYISEIKGSNTDKKLQFNQNNEKVKPQGRRTKSNKSRRISSVVSSIISKAKNIANSKSSSKYRKKSMTLFSEVEKYQVTPNERRFFGNVYLSDYLINNAIRNNAHYLGRYILTEEYGGDVTFDFPTDEETVRACYFATQNQGEIIQNTSTRTKRTKVENLEEVFENLKLKQHLLVSEARKRARRASYLEDR